MFDTIIIGAGIAGLAAGNYLQNHSHDNFIILESFHNIGGRVQTIEFNNTTFPSGPGWVHGKKGNPIFDILSNLNVSMELSHFMEPGAVFAWNTVEGKDCSELYTERRQEFNNLLDKITEELQDKVLEPEKNLQEMLSEHSKIFNNLTDFDKTVLFSSIEIYIGAPLNEISGLSELQNDEIYQLDEEIINHRILDPFGVPKMIDYLSQDLKEKILLNCKVKTINWSNDSDHVVITSEDEKRFICKNVIITVQSDLLAKGHITFIPSLPEEKISALRNVPAVNYCRVFAKFERKFWPDNEWFLPILENVDPINELLFWQNCSRQNLCAENDNILVCHYTSGWKTERCRFDVDKESLTELVTEAMRNIFPSDYCRPTDVLFLSHWNSDRFAGSFSVPAPGMDKPGIEQLRKRVGPLRFAGESVIVELIGTMQAAYLSGQDAAKDILQ